MILVIGALGFIGSHATRSLLDAGDSCLVTQHRSTDIPEFLRDEINERLICERIDATDRNTLLALGDKYSITGIVYFAGALSRNAFNDVREASCALANTLEAAATWKV